MARHFRYEVESEDIQGYVMKLGYITENCYNPDRSKIIGLSICGTTILIGYDIMIGNQVVSSREISMMNNPFSIGSDNEKEERSIKLYQKLYRRYHKRPST